MSRSCNNKHESVKVRKKNHRGYRYICCTAPSRNSGKNKFSKRFCCTYPSVYKRNDVKRAAIIEGISFMKTKNLS